MLLAKDTAHASGLGRSIVTEQNHVNDAAHIFILAHAHIRASVLLPVVGHKDDAVAGQATQQPALALRIPTGLNWFAGSPWLTGSWYVACRRSQAWDRSPLPARCPACRRTPVHTSQIEGLPRPPGAPAPAYLVKAAHVDVAYFDALDQPILSGRNFNTGDLGEDRSAVIVNTSFVERVLGGRNPLGRRLRYWEPGQEPGPWSFEIVGVVGPLGMNTLFPDADQGMYHVVAPGELHPVSFVVRVGSDPEQFTPRLRSIVTAIDASALIQSPVALNEVPSPERRILMLGTYLVALLAGIAVVLSAACLYALVSFTVARRTRECGIRTALGARPAHIVSAIAKRALLQLSVGVSIGAVLSAGMFSAYGRDGGAGAILRTANWPVTVGLIALFVIVVGMLACLKPTLRALRIRPMEALKG